MNVDLKELCEKNISMETRASMALGDKISEAYFEAFKESLLEERKIKCNILIQNY